MCMPLPETLRSGEQLQAWEQRRLPWLGVPCSPCACCCSAPPSPIYILLLAATGGWFFFLEGGRKEKRKRQREFKEREQKRRRERRVKETECYTSWGLEKPKIIENRRRLPWVESILLCRTGVYKGSKSFFGKAPNGRKRGRLSSVSEAEKQRFPPACTSLSAFKTAASAGMVPSLPFLC